MIKTILINYGALFVGLLLGGVYMKWLEYYERKHGGRR